MKNYDNLPLSLLRTLKEVLNYRDNCDESVYRYKRSMDYLVYTYGIELVNDGIRCIHNVYRQTERVTSRVRLIYDNFPYVYFGTLTINDDNINRDNMPKFRKILRENFALYLGNTDYGDKNGRLHFHFIAGSLTEYNFKWNRGYQCIKLVNTSMPDTSINRVSTYMTKIIRHALKTSAQELIWSRIDYKIIELARVQRRLNNFVLNGEVLSADDMFIE